MANSADILLDLRAFSSDEPGWRNVTASNGQPYSYCYSGGDDDAGGLEMTVGDGQGAVLVRLVAGDGYMITSCEFSGDGDGQLSWSASGNQAGMIIDRNSAVVSAQYCILITDRAADCTIRCDPPITNRPCD